LLAPPPVLPLTFGVRRAARLKSLLHEGCSLAEIARSSPTKVKNVSLDQVWLTSFQLSR